MTMREPNARSTGLEADLVGQIDRSVRPEGLDLGRAGWDTSNTPKPPKGASVQPSDSSIPKWVKATLAILAIAALAVAALLATGHSPGRHFAPSAQPGAADQTDRS